MIILFGRSKLHKIINDDKLLRRKYGALASTIRSRLDDLKAAETLSVIAKLPHHKCHELKGDREGCLAITLREPYRLVFEPADEPSATKPDGGIDWDKVRSIRIIEIIDYH